MHDNVFDEEAVSIDIVENICYHTCHHKTAVEHDDTDSVDHSLAAVGQDDDDDDDCGVS